MCTHVDMYSSQIVTQVVAEDPDISFNAEIHYAVLTTKMDNARGDDTSTSDGKD